MKTLMALKNRKGFTLVEVIVVLVILAILAAILVPTMTGYIDKANEKVVVSEARAVLMALQVEASDAYNGNKTATTLADTAITKAATMAEVAAGSITEVTVSGGKVTGFTYTGATYKFEMTGSNFAGAKITKK